MSFRGDNTIVLNQSTMREAVQYWLDHVFMPGKAPEVDLIAPESGPVGWKFHVRTTEPKAES